MIIWLGVNCHYDSHCYDKPLFNNFCVSDCRWNCIQWLLVVTSNSSVSLFILNEDIGPRDLRLKLQKKEEKQKYGVRDLREKLSGVQSRLQKAEPVPAPTRPKPASQITKPVRYDPAVGAKQALPLPAASKETLKQVWSIIISPSSLPLSLSSMLMCVLVCTCIVCVGVFFDGERDN